MVDQLDGAPCLLVRCTGRLGPGRAARQLLPAALRGRPIRAGSWPASTPACSTARTRLAYETGFKQSRTDPGAPNVLVATPTLEMGIDIGDLSVGDARVAAAARRRPTCSGWAGPDG